MKQIGLALTLSTRQTRKQVFLEQMEQGVPWQDLVQLIAPYYPQGRNGRPPFELQTMLRLHFLQQWFKLSDLGMEEALFDTPLYRDFAQLDAHGRLPDESTILRFRHRLERHKLAEQMLATVNDLLCAKGLQLKEGTIVDATLMAAPSSTKNKDNARDPERQPSKKANQWYFGLKAHIGVDAERGPVHNVGCPAGNVGAGKFTTVAPINVAGSYATDVSCGDFESDTVCGPTGLAFSGESRKDVCVINGGLGAPVVNSGFKGATCAGPSTPVTLFPCEIAPSRAEVS